MVFHHLSQEEGLSQNTVNAILQDSQGFIWLGTENGLNRYDGNGFVRYMRNANHGNGLDSDFIWAINEDRNTDIWLATEGAGLVRWERSSGEFHPAQMPDDAASRRGRSLLIDTQGQIWLGTRGGGLLQFDAQGRLLRQYKHDDAPEGLSSNNVSALLQRDHNTLLLGTDAGLQSLSLDTGSFQTIQGPSVSISSLYLDTQKRLWAGSFDDGLFRLLSGTSGLRHYRHHSDVGSLSSNQIRAIVQDAEQRIWIATQDGLNLYRADSDDFIAFRHQDNDRYSLADDRLMSLHQGQDGMLWVGSRLGGVSRWNPRSWSLGAHSPEQMRGAAVLAFADDLNGRIWVGGFGMPLLLVARDGAVQASFDPANGYPERGDVPVTALLCASDGRLWIGTMNQGLQIYDPQTNRLQTLSSSRSIGLPAQADSIMSLYQAADGRIWAGTFGASAISIDPRNLSIEHHAPPDHPDLRVTAIRQDPRGQFWLGTDGSGLFRLQPAEDRWSQFKHTPDQPSNLDSDTVFALHIGRGGELWIGTAGAGMAQIPVSQLSSNQPHFNHWTTAQGLSNNVINGIREDAGGQLWLSSNSGLMRFDPQDHTLRFFHRSQGLQSEEFNFGAHHASSDGRLFFGGAGGYNGFDPTGLDHGRPGPALALTGIELLNQALHPGSDYSALQELILAHDEDVITFTYAALDFADPARNLYSVMLEGFDRDWSPASHRHRSTYTNLDPGRYLFRVRAATSDGYWSSGQLTLPIIVKAAPWATPQAYALYIVLLIILAALFFRWRLKTLEREAHIRQLAFYDRVTGLPNHEMFSDRLDDAVAQAQQSGSSLCVICLRLSTLHRLQDSLGYRSMDEVLRTLSPRLTQLLFGRGPTSSRRDLARLSENEFVVFIELEDPQTQGSMWARRLCEAINSPLYFGDHQVKITAHAGIASFPQDGSGSRLIEAAGTAASEASTRADGSFTFYAEDMTRRARERLQLESELRQAISDDALNLFLQGKFDCTGQLVGAEALSRWQHPVRGPVSPGIFVPLAEESDLILELDAWVLEQAYRQLQNWDRQGYLPISIAVNVSAETFTSGRIFSALEYCQRRYAIDPARLEIEITESVLASDMNLITESLKRLKQLGHKLALDDFGTGYSSLTYLQQFPIDKLKIDQAFVRDLEQNPDQQALCTAIISLAGSLRMQTIAEGVENEAQRDLLLNLGCDQIQGFFLHRPQAAEAFATILLAPQDTTISL